MTLVEIVLAAIAFASVACVVLDVWAKRKIRAVVGGYERRDR